MIHDTNLAQDQFVKLLGLSSFLEQQGSLDECLDEIVAMSANILCSHNCSIMLFREDDLGGGMSLRMFAKFGEFPAAAASEVVKVSKGIAGHVAATAQPLLVRDILESEFQTLARAPEAASRSFICVPIIIGGKVIGVMNVKNPVAKRCFDNEDLNLSVFVALLVGKSIQVIELQNLLNSRFAQMSVVLESEDVSGAITPERYDADKLVKMLSRSFYREMTNAGFGRAHIISAASEIISLLTLTMQKHEKRIQREGE